MKFISYLLVSISLTGCSSTSGIGTGIVEIWQKDIRNVYNGGGKRQCVFTPSCSQYAKEVFEEYGFVKGAILTSERLERCHACAFSYPYSRTKANSLIDPPYVKSIKFTPPEWVTSIHSPKLQGSSADEQWNFANHLFVDKNYQAAFIEFERLTYFFPNSEVCEKAKIMKAACLYYLQDMYGAIEQLEKLTENKDNKFAADILLSHIYSEIGQSVKAQQLLDNLLKDINDPKLCSIIYLKKGVIFISDEKWQQAEDCFNKVKYPEYKEAVILLKDRLKEGELKFHKSPTFGGIMSAVIPGSGQIYSGRTKDGINAFLLNLLLIGGSVKAFKGNENVTGASLATVGLFFYLGNVFGGVSAAEKYNEEEGRKIIEDARYNIRDNQGIEGTTFTILDFIFKF